MEITLIAVGKLRTPGTHTLFEEYSKRISRYCKFSLLEIPEAAGRCANTEQAIALESGRILNKLGETTFALCTPDGEAHTSPGLAAWLDRALTERGKIAIVIGGSDGVSAEVQSRAAWTLSFSRLTFPHQLFRGILAEQLYRAFTILRNHPYHK